MSEEKSSPIGIIVVVAVIAVVAAFFIGKSGGGNGDQTAGNQQQPTNGSDTNKTVPQSEPTELKEPAFVKDGLVAYYPFNGNANDESGNGNNGTVTGATLTADRNGSADKAYSFDGVNDDIRVGSLSGNPRNQMTISAWVYNLDSSTGRRTIIRKDSINGANPIVIGPVRKMDWGLYLSDDKKIYFDVFPESGAGQSGTQHSLSSPTLDSAPFDQWSHIIAVYDGVKMHLYLNGGKMAEKNATGLITNGSFSFNIGSIDRVHEFANGSLDDIRIYNRALSAGEVKALYEFEKPKK
jgi:hypothetical protein